MCVLHLTLICNSSYLVYIVNVVGACLYASHCSVYMFSNACAASDVCTYECICMNVSYLMYVYMHASDVCMHACMHVCVASNIHVCISYLMLVFMYALYLVHVCMYRI